MFRPSRPTLHWLLWLVMALLPLRGWAQVQMDNDSGWNMAAAAVANAPEQLPCHATASHPPDATQGLEAGHDSASWSESGSCSHCTVCHASLGLSLPLALDWPPLPHAAPTPQVVTSVADQPPGKLFRPPRSSRA